MTIETVKAAVTDENVQDIVDTAAYGGITYWAGQPTDAEFEACPEDKEYTIVEVDDDERTAHYLSKDDVREAYAKLLDLDQKFVGPQVHGYILTSWRDRTPKGGIDCGEIDAEAADCIIQVACLGEITYG